MLQFLHKFLYKLKDLFFYAGLEKHDYDAVAPSIHKHNNAILNVFSISGSILSFGILILSVFIESMRMYSKMFLFLFIFIIVVAILGKTVCKTNFRMNTFVINLILCVLLCFSIILTMFVTPDDHTVTFMVMLVFLPTLFELRPIDIISTTVPLIGIFIILAFHFKTGNTLIIDVMNVVMYGMLSIITSSILNVKKIKNTMDKCQLEKLGTFDILTKLNNRNAFESNLSKYERICGSVLGCIYIDVNGLHELNNTKGHESGDEMLKYVAHAIRKYFGEDNAYRIGGDEFVIFVNDLAVLQAGDLIKDLNNDITSKGYHIAVGFDTMRVENLNVDELIKSSEKLMYDAKVRYYSRSGYDRRNC